MENGEFDRILNLLTQRMDSMEDRMDQMGETLRSQLESMGDRIERQIELMNEKHDKQIAKHSDDIDALQADINRLKGAAKLLAEIVGALGIVFAGIQLISAIMN